MSLEKATSQRLNSVLDRFDKAKISWVVFAGAAAYCYGSGRAVTDIDILVKDADLKRAENLLGDFDGFDVVADLEITTDQGTCLFYLDDEIIRGRS